MQRTVRSSIRPARLSDSLFRLDPIRCAVMTSNTRRAAGTQTFFDVLKTWSGRKRPNPAQDLADFAAGMTLQVSCFTRPLGEPKARFRLGTLHLTRGEPVTWRKGKDLVTHRPPLTLADSADEARQPQLAAFTLVSGSGSFSVEIPTLDVELVKHAIRTACLKVSLPARTHAGVLGIA
jgi:hypothetical protein